MNLIASADENWGIGYQGKLLCRMPEDMLWFKEHTMNKTVVMGQVTLESLPGSCPLTNRVNIVLSDDPDFFAQGCIVVHNLKELWAQTAAYADDEIFVIGGASVYNLLLPYCRKAYITKFHKNFPADRYLPNLDELPEWHLLIISDDQWHDDLRYNFCVYENDNPQIPSDK